MLRSCNLASPSASASAAFSFDRTPPSTSFCRSRACNSLSSLHRDVLRVDHPAALQNVNTSSWHGVHGIEDEVQRSSGSNPPGPSAEYYGQKHSNHLHCEKSGGADTRLLDRKPQSAELAGQQPSEQEDYTNPDPFEPIAKISVPRQKYIPVPKSSLVQALASSFNDDTKAAEFRMICSLLDLILHAEHKTTLEQMRLDYRITRSASKEESKGAKGKSAAGRRGRKKKGMIGILWDIIYKLTSANKVAKGITASMRTQLENTALGEKLKVISDSESESLTDKQDNERATSTENGTLAGNHGNSTSENNVPSTDTATRNCITAAARFQRAFLKLLRNARFQGLSTRDLQLTSALNSDYLLTLPIDVDWKLTSSKVAVIFRRGYTSERQEGLMFGAKFDYIQSLLLRKVANWFTRPVFKSGTWINQKLKSPKESERSKTWAEEFTEWLKEPLKPEMDDDVSGIIADSLTDEEKEDYLPVWAAAQQAVPRYEAFLSSAGARGMLLRKILIWMRVLPPPSSKDSEDSGIGSAYLVPSRRGYNLARISMRDIWLPASKMVCGNDTLQRIRAVFSIIFSRSVLQEPAHKELVLLYNVSNLADDDGEDQIPDLQLKIYGKIPIPDLKVIFPNKKLSYRIVDTVRLDIATIIGLLAFLINYRFDDFLSSPSAFVLDIIASSALLVYVTRVALGYKQTYDRYQLLVNRTLYEKTLASDFGAAHFLVDASEQQQFKECILAIGLLMNRKNAEVETRESLSVKCETFLQNLFKKQVEMPIDDAVTNLSRLGLIVEERTEDCNVLHPKPYGESLSVLRERWTDLVNDGSSPTSFLCSLYQTASN